MIIGFNQIVEYKNKMFLHINNNRRYDRKVNQHKSNSNYKMHKNKSNKDVQES